MPMDIDDPAHQRQAADLPISYPSSLTLNPAALDRPNEHEHEREHEQEFTTAGFGGAFGGGSVREGLVEVADKSCSVCRIRKVKCDRIVPECTRCRKRGEVCDFGEGVALVMRRIVPAIPSSASHGDSPKSPSFRSDHVARPYPPPARPPHRFSEFSLAPSSAALAVVSRQEDPVDNIASSWDAFLRTSDIGPRSVDTRLGQPAMATSLTLSLLDASMHSCCFHLPAFHIFEGRIDHYKKNLATLDVQSQVVVAILTSLGARASPHSAVLGVEGPGPDCGTPNSQALVLSAGRRRENAWRAITDRAVTLCSIDIMNGPSRSNIEVLIAITNMLLFSEVVPIKARFFLRQALGLYKDIHSVDDLPDEELRSLKKDIGPALYESDARTAAYATMPFLIRGSDLVDFFNETGVLVPDLAQEDLGVSLDNILSPAWGPITRAKLSEALATTGFYVSAVQRNYAAMATDRNPARLVFEADLLWDQIDRVHRAVQKLHRILSSLTYTPGGGEPEHDHALDYDLLIGVRMDNRLVDIVNLTHKALLGRRERLRWTPHEAMLEDLIAVSEKRVRKCLKLLAFYADVFTRSLDKHIVYHLVVQAEVLPWVSMAVQRVGEEGGPTSVEYEVSETELDWFSNALELACFYTPLASIRLQQLQEGRASRRFSSPGSIFLPTPGSDSTTHSHSTSNSHGSSHTHSPPHSQPQLQPRSQSHASTSSHASNSPGEHSSSQSPPDRSYSLLPSPPVYPQALGTPSAYPPITPSNLLDPSYDSNTFDYSFGSAYSPGGSAAPVDFDFSALLAASGGTQSPLVPDQNPLPVFDDRAWQQEDTSQW